MTGRCSTGTADTRQCVPQPLAGLVETRPLLDRSRFLAQWTGLTSRRPLTSLGEDRNLKGLRMGEETEDMVPD